MHIANLFKIQENKCNDLVVDNTLSEYKITARKHLELHIAMSDLANETQCYRYWIGNEKVLDDNMIFHKYITCFKHLISLGLYNKYGDMDEIDIELSDYCLSDQFLNLYIDINDLMISPSKDHFVTLTEDFLSLGISLGFTEKMIIDEFNNSYK
ncbi:MULTISPECIES: dUTP diphosphatase [Clostridium]|uniref:dUTP diphosphatase n=1 Tax=Clostridium cibarium TaxID=2762247 RepID=A0ABR8PWM9_9CLOT|nr:MULTISPECIES: dUTP diphosphatase [Clostridium]MBD7912590.1 dUTP diphosphatase [Clostridium cibarium]